MNPQKEDAVKAKAYLEFEQEYFSNREDGKTKAIQLSSEERLGFSKKQREYVENIYQEAINKECRGKKIREADKK